MKRTFLISVSTLFLFQVQAQFFTPGAFSGALLGGIAGGIIGHNSGRKTAEGIGLGAGAGLLLGALADNSRQYGVSDYAMEVPLYHSPGYYTHPPPYYYSYEPRRPNYAITGAALGGLTGGVIGHNSGRRTAEGVAIGAGTGLLLGSLAEHHARERERSQTQHARRHVVSVPAAGPAQISALETPPTTLAAHAGLVTRKPDQSTGSTAMGAANRLFGR